MGVSGEAASACLSDAPGHSAEGGSSTSSGWARGGSAGEAGRWVERAWPQSPQLHPRLGILKAVCRGAGPFVFVSVSFLSVKQG